MSLDRDHHPLCPRCQIALDREGDRRVCGRCKGVMIGEPALHALIVQLSAQAEPPPDALPFGEAIADEQVRPCPDCPTTMTKHALYKLQVDRCPAHGVWFDTDELRLALERVALDKGSAVARAYRHTRDFTEGLLRLVFRTPGPLGVRWH